MKKLSIIIYLLFLASIIWMCNQPRNQSNVNEISNKLQACLDSLIDTKSEDPIYNAVLLVESSRIKWKGSAGLADGEKEIMTADHKIKIASIGKTFTATIILQLIEEGYLKIDDKIDMLLDSLIVNLDSLHVYKGIAYGRQITIRQILSHSSGMIDYMEDTRFINDVMDCPKKQYNSVKILEKYFEYQSNLKAMFPPGEGYNYSDVNYVLLAMIIEQVTGETYHAQLKTRIFDRLGMDNSYLEYYEESRGEKPLSHAFFGTFDLVADINTSFDWGGGGIVSTCEELNTFIRALVDGKLFKKESTLKLMLSEADKGNGGIDYDYGLGIMKRKIHGLTFYGHGGAYDCDMFYCPEKNICVCMSLNQMNTHGKRDKFLQQVIKYLM